MDTGAGKTITLRILGSSMYPTIKFLDMAYVVPYGKEAIACGDVIVYTDRIRGRKIAHRIVSRHDDGLLTRGDNNLEEDPGRLSPGAIIGKVAFVVRGGRSITVHGGRRGLAWHDTLRLLLRGKKMAVTRMVAVYHYAAGMRFFKRFGPKAGNIKILTFQRPGYVERQFRMGPFLIGRFNDRTKKMCIEPPFKLFVENGFLLDAMEARRADPENGYG